MARENGEKGREAKRSSSRPPWAGRFESTASFVKDPYRFIAKRCAEVGEDLFESRLQLKRTVFLTGKEGARLFYDADRFQREGAAPGFVRKTLFGEGGAQTLDGASHRSRKEMFLNLLNPAAARALAERARLEWERAARGWELADEPVVLATAAREIIGRSVFAWAEVPLREDEFADRVSDLSALFDEAGTIGLGHFRARRARARLERWAAELIEATRSGRLETSAGSVLRTVASHRDPDGEQLEPRVAAVELLNVLRPTIAVSVYVAYVALALLDYPECRYKVETRQHGYAELFAQETRRFYPFFPAVIAKARRDFEWRGFRFPKGRQVVLDLYGTNHDPREWEEPDAFRPERFRGRVSCPFSFVPQGGGDALTNHRCPGEDVAIEIMKGAAEFLTCDLEYEVPEQDLSVDFARLPALPRSGFAIRKVRLRGSQ